MLSKVQKWGNSLAVRIPRLLAQETGLSAEAAVEIRVRDGYLVVEPLRAPSYSLAELLDRVTPANLHEEEDLGGAMGGEAW